MTARLTATLLATLMVCLAHGQPVTPMITAGWIEPVVIDGAIGEGEWAGATGVGAFAELGGALRPGGPSCFAAADERGFVLACVNEGEPRAQQRERDGALWQDDAVEVFLKPQGSADYYQVIVNAHGDVADCRGRDAAWNARVEAAAGSADGRWTVEVRVPWEDLGGPPQPGDVWRVNFARDIAGAKPLTWAPVKSSFHEPEHFGEMRFAAGGPAIGVTSVRQTDDHRLLIDARCRGAAALNATLLTDGVETAGATGTEECLLDVPIEQPGRYVLRMAGVADGQTLFRQEVPIVRRAPVEITLTKALLEARRVIVQMDASASEQTPDGYRVQVGDLAPVWVEAGAQPLLAEATVSIAGLQPDTIPVVAEALRGEEVVAQWQTTFTLPPDPAWLGSDIGRSSEVPEPWTPVEAEGDSVRVWGREYTFSRGPLLGELTTREAQVLAAPMRLRTVAGGRQQVWRDAELRWTDRTDERAIGTVTATGDGASLSCEVRCEFDGMIVFALQVTPEEGQALERVVLEIPLREEHARYLHLADASWAGSVATALPEEGWTHHFMPLVWLGDEERGVQWFSESDEGWRPEEPERAITIERRDGVATLRLHMIERALEPGAPFSTTFGLQATPVRAIPPEHREWHITHGAWYGMEEQPVTSAASVSYPAEGNVPLDAGTIEMWVSPLFDPALEVEPETRGRFNRELLRIVQPGGDHLGFYWNIDDRSMRLYSRLSGEVALYASPGPREPWQQGSWHHVAFTWGEGLVTVWLDGEKLASRAWTDPLLPGTLEGGQVLLGSTATSTPSEFAVGGLRISDMPRIFDSQPPASLMGDKRTLLLDDFEGEAPRVIAAGTRATEDDAELRETDGPAGSAVALGDPGTQALLLDYLKSRDVNTLVIHEQWTEIQAYGSTSLHAEKLRSLVEACHARDIRLLIYFGYELSDAAPEWELYRDEVLVKPQRGGYTRKDFPQTAYICCFESAWKEYYLTSIARMIDEFDVDGVYLDGTTEPWGCTNALHGCGYIGEDGQRHRTYPIFAVRDLMRRMREVVKSRKPDGLISAHMSATVSMPTMAFIDSYWDGEQLDVHGPGFRLPLDAFRAEFMGHNWGIPAEFLSYLDKPFSYEESVPLALLHDVPVRPYARGALLEMMAPVWAAWETIDIERAEWFPYWREGGPVRTEAENVLVSTHVGTGGSLVVAMNASDADIATRLRLSAPATEATELLTGRPMPITDGAIEATIPAWEGVVLLVR